MSEKKHIDRVFQESFKDFEVSPRDAVWANIEAELKKKNKKRRVIPVWWRYAGVAAILLLFLSLGGMYFNNTKSNTNYQIVDDNSIENKTNSDTNSPIQLGDTGTSNTFITKNNSAEPADHSEVLPQESSAIAVSNSEVIAETPVSANKNSNKPEPNKNTSFQETIALTNTSNGSSAIANSNTDESIKKDDFNAPLVDDKKQNELIAGNSKNNIALNDNDRIKELPENNIQNNSKQKNSLTIEEALDKNKDVIADNTPESRWSVAPNIAPVYFNTLNEGSSIDNQFNSNSKTGEVNMSYGIATSYALNKKLKIRSGINKVNLGYNTNDVVVFQTTSGSSSSSLKNVDKSTSSIAVGSSQNLESNASAPPISDINTSINQSFGYIEVPLEIQYTFIDKRLGLNVIGGFSSFFLDSNEIYSERDNGVKTYLGEANNINDVSYSANFGLGLNYRFTKKIDLNLEPTFKYQFNTFSNTTGDFTPFFIGVYTGFAIKF
ncbi:hypothetical protein [Algibacter mikhailovii]|uniref:hypothetical protein n=1 Tax=Algibacter mikhailovii TaxID=425498 RepID=UPI00249411BE|nr:hypothetical protein [Algibacter mikhailovii]